MAEIDREAGPNFIFYVYRQRETQMAKAFIESFKMSHTLGTKERLTIKGFADSSAMHKFLCTGDNALRWRESSKDLKAGTYAFAGGRWHNVKTLDASTLAHI